MFFALTFAIHHDTCARTARIGRNKIGVTDQKASAVVEMDAEGVAGVFVFEDLLDSAHFVLNSNGRALER